MDRVGEVVRRYRVEEALAPLLDALGTGGAAFSLLPPMVGVQGGNVWQAVVHYGGTRASLCGEGATAAAALVALLRELEGQRGQGGDGGVA